MGLGGSHHADQAHHAVQKRVRAVQEYQRRQRDAGPGKYDKAQHLTQQQQSTVPPIFSSG